MSFDQLKCLCPEFRDSIYDFNRVPDSREVMRKLLEYDNQLFMLWSRIHNRWELWRWKTGVLPRQPTSEREVYELARLQVPFPVGFQPDERLIRNLPAADLWRAAGTNDPNKVAEQREQEAEQGMRKDEATVRGNVKDLVEDNVPQLRRDVQDAFRGFYPSDEEKRRARERREKSE